MALNLSREQSSGVHVLNLGSGEGVSVLEAIQAFEKASEENLSISWAHDEKAMLWQSMQITQMLPGYSMDAQPFG